MRASQRSLTAATTRFASRRNFASKQCAEVRGELAGAIARLSSRANLVSDSRARAREVSSFNQTLVLRLVEAEMRSWRPSAPAGNVRMGVGGGDRRNAQNNIKGGGGGCRERYYSGS